MLLIMKRSGRYEEYESEKLAASLTRLTFGLPFDAEDALRMRQCLHDIVVTVKLANRLKPLPSADLFGWAEEGLREAGMSRLADRCHVANMHKEYPKAAFGGSPLDSALVHAIDFDYDGETLKAFREIRIALALPCVRPQHLLGELLLQRLDRDHIAAAQAYRMLELPGHDETVESIRNAVSEAVERYVHWESIENAPSEQEQKHEQEQELGGHE